MKTTQHTQVIQFESGHKKTFKNIVEVTDGEMVKLTNNKGVEFLIKRDKVEWISRDTKKKKEKVSVSEEPDYY